MGEPKLHQPVKLFYGILINDLSLLENVKEKLTILHGKIDVISQIWDFNFTNYYCKEMGNNIKRIFFAFEDLIQPEMLLDIKIKSNAIEKEYLNFNNRCVNLDPGYLSLAKVVLASTKDNIQRLYLGKGIYAEITLYYKNFSFQPFQWTFIDYKEKYIPFFNDLRKIYANQLKQM